MRNSLELIIQDHDSMCKIFPTTFIGSARAWYNNLEPNFIEGVGDLWAKLVACFSTSIPAMKISIDFLCYPTRGRVYTGISEKIQCGDAQCLRTGACPLE
jgi:hypothetical protein